MGTYPGVPLWNPTICSSEFSVDSIGDLFDCTKFPVMDEFRITSKNTVIAITRLEVESIPIISSRIVCFFTVSILSINGYF